MSTIQDLSASAQNKKAALGVLATAASQHQELLVAWQRSMDLIWLSADPVGCVAELGNLAAAIFQISSMTCEFLEAMAPGCTLERRQAMAQWTITPNADGTVTVVPPPTSEAGD